MRKKKKKKQTSRRYHTPGGGGKKTRAKVGPDQFGSKGATSQEEPWGKKTTDRLGRHTIVWGGGAQKSSAPGLGKQQKRGDTTQQKIKKKWNIAVKKGKVEGVAPEKKWGKKKMKKKNLEGIKNTNWVKRVGEGMGGKKKESGKHKKTNQRGEKVGVRRGGSFPPKNDTRPRQGK